MFLLILSSHLISQILLIEHKKFIEISNFYFYLSGWRTVENCWRAKKDSWGKDETRTRTTTSAKRRTKNYSGQGKVQAQTVLLIKNPGLNWNSELFTKKNGKTLYCSFMLKWFFCFVFVFLIWKIWKVSLF